VEQFPQIKFVSFHSLFFLCEMQAVGSEIN
jgi:hypothetical protein